MRRDMPFLDMSLAIGGHLRNMQIKNCHWVKFSTPGENDDSIIVHYIIHVAM